MGMAHLVDGVGRKVQHTTRRTNIVLAAAAEAEVKKPRKRRQKKQGP
jgi:hypothetical protein